MIFLTFLLGLAVGSFINLLIDRLPKGEDIIFKRSHCDFCRKTLRIADLVPLISFLFLKGRCRYCRRPLSLKYPLFELLTAFLFVFVYLKYPLSGSLESLVSLFYYWLAVSVLLVIFFIDLRHHIIPDGLTLILTLTTLFYQWLYLPQFFLSNILSGAGFMLLFLFLFLVTRGRGMGFGDVKLSFFIGMFAGFPKIIVVFYLAFLTGALLSLILVSMGKKKLKSTIAFGPFLVAAAFVGHFYGDSLIRFFSQFV